MILTRCLLFFFLSQQTDYSEWGILSEKFLLAEELFQQGIYDEAEKLYKKLLSRFSKTTFSTEIEFRIAECYFNEGKFEDALKLFLKMYYKNQYEKGYILPEIVYSLVILYAVLNDFEKANEYLQILVTDPAYRDLERTKFAVGLLFYLQGKYELAAERLKDVDTLPEGLFFLGRAYTKLKRPVDAVPVFRKLISNYSGTIFEMYATYAMADVYYYYGDYQAAAVKFKDFIKRSIEFERSYPIASRLRDYATYFYGVCKLHLGEYDEAIKILKKLVNHRDYLLAAHAGFFLADAMMKKALVMKEDTSKVKADSAKILLEEATKCFLRVREMANTATIAALALFKLAQVYLYRNDTNQVYLTSAQLTELFSTGEPIFRGEKGKKRSEDIFESLRGAPAAFLMGIGPYLSGVVLYYFGDYYKAAEKFLEVIEYFGNSDFAEPSAAMAVLSYVAAKDWDRAIAVANTYLKSHPKPKEINKPWRAWLLYGLAEALYYSYRFPEAENIYRDILQNFKEGKVVGYALAGIGWTLLNQGNYEDAVKELEAAVSYKDKIIQLQSRAGLGIAYFNLADQNLSQGIKEKNSDKVYEADKNINKAIINFERGLSYLYYGDTIVNNFIEQGLKDEKSLKLPDRVLKMIDTAWVPRFVYYIGKSYHQWGRISKVLEKKYSFNPQFYNSMVFLKVNFPKNEYTPKGLYELGEILKKGPKNFKKMALGLFRWIVKNHPSNPLAPSAQCRIGEIFNMLGQYDSAYVAYNEVFIQFPSAEEIVIQDAKEGLYENMILKNTTIYQVGNREIEIARDSIAVEELDKFASTYPGSEHSQRARLANYYYYLLIKKDTLRAAEELLKLVTEWPDNERSMLFMWQAAFLYRKINKWKDALEVYERFRDFYAKNQKWFAKDPKKCIQSYYWIGVCRMELNEYKKAIEAFGKYLTYKDSLNPQDILDATINLALSYRNVGNREKARLYFKQAKKMAIDLGDKWALGISMKSLIELATSEEEKQKLLQEAAQYGLIRK